MPRMRALKQELKTWLSADNWQSRLPDIAALHGREAAGPLLSFLLLGGEMTCRAAVALGVSVAALAEQDMEPARNIMRRLMWHMNEESGNIGWGVPEAFAEILARSPRLCKEFAHVLLSYIVDTGRDDNYCDHDVLRRSCYWAVGRLAQVHPEMDIKARPWLVRGLEDGDVPCRGMAAWALAQLPPSLESMPPLRRLAAAGHDDPCQVFDGQTLRQFSVTELAELALRHP